MGEFIVTTSLKKLYATKSRIVVCQSGTYCGKSYNILAILIDIAARQPKTRILVVGETIPSIKSGCVNDFKNIMETTERWFDEHWNSTDRLYTFANKSTIQFSSFDGPSKAKAAGKRDILFLNECNQIRWEVANELITRTSERIYIDYNPTSEFWVHREIIGSKDCEVVNLMYHDNEAIPENIVQMLEDRLEKSKTSEYWLNWCKVYIYGETGSVEGNIFNNYEIIDFIPEEAEFMGYGMDFGFNDPTTIIAVYKYNDGYLVDEILHRTRMVTPEIGDFIKKEDLKGMIIADSAEPAIITELQRMGLNVVKAFKGQGSIKAGLDILLRETLYITSKSLNIIEEIRNYKWLVDPTGKVLDEPVDEFNHCFVGETLISTINGDIKIKNIKIGDLVLTSEGYKKVLKVFNNGKKQVVNYSLFSDTGNINLIGTNNHKIKTKKGWKKLSELKKGDVIYQHKNLMEKSITNTEMKNIHQIKLVDVIENQKYNEEVYDLMVEDCHEYFANNILVHNCIDSVRYCVFFHNTQRENINRVF